MISTPSPVVSLASARYQESLRRTQVESSISNHDTPGVDAVATPAGRWWMLTKNAIGKNWYLFIDQQRDVLTTGRVKVSFSVDEGGKLHRRAGGFRLRQLRLSTKSACEPSARPMFPRRRRM